MEHRLSRFGVAVALGLLVTIFAFLLMAPAAVTNAEMLQRPLLAPAIYLTEGFDSTTFPPAGWVTQLLTGTTNWVRSTGTIHSGSGSAYFSYATPGYAARLETPLLNFSAAVNPKLRFWMYHSTSYSSYNDRIEVRISTDGGINYTTVLTTLSRYDGSSVWKLNQIDLTAYAGQSTVKLGFVGITEDGLSLYIDDVSIREPLH